MGDNSNQDKHNKDKHNQVKVKLSPEATIESTDRLAEEAEELRGTLGFLTKKLERLSVDMEKAQLKEYVNLMQRPWQLIWKNFLSGLSRGVGIALGFTFFAATIVYLLQFLGALNLPIVGDYIADIVRIVQRQLEINPY
ncbi:hypothetical protein KCTCHS21_40530 [Cohnella abietis]|uniref:Uncharacterized protein n=2 Tax=Cohnella abietis TaxID=2507935 RepID=A0A3T1D9A6_9BACL|nr:DUF5665 domain-containing protein [Cohnella abietis]BBI34654.1 hypothetical protein KCTCHS21_40530 [Cohnella abietis]